MRTHSFGYVVLVVATSVGACSAEDNAATGSSVSPTKGSTVETPLSSSPSSSGPVLAAPTTTTLAPPSFCAHAPSALADSELQYSSPTTPDSMRGFDDLTESDQTALRSAVRIIVADINNDGLEYTQWTDEPIIEVVNRICGLELISGDRVS